jgi:intracellular sulfur oxidation DsrE/DsrF family protein
MDIVFHGRGIAVSDRMRQRAVSGVRKQTARLDRAVDAIIRFEEDGPTRRVEIVLHTPRHRWLVAKAEGRYFGPALTEALARLRIQIAGMKKTVRARAARVRAVARA